MTGRLVLDYDPDDLYERNRAASIVRCDDELLRRVLWKLCEDLRRVARGKQSRLGETGPELCADQAEAMLLWIKYELDGVPLSLEE